MVVRSFLSMDRLMHDRSGFTLVEMYLVMFIICIFLSIYSIPNLYSKQTLTLSMFQLQSFLEKVQSEAVIERKQRTIRFKDNLVIADDETLKLPSSIRCVGAELHFYPQYTSAPAATIRCSAGSEQSLVIQLGRGRNAIRREK